MSDSTKETEVFTITPLGLFCSYLNDDKLAKSLAEGLELYLRRNGVGIAIDDNRMRFVELVRTEAEEARP
jgi:hypothetical protein